MTVHKFGRGNKRIIVPLHPSAVMWDYFDSDETPVSQKVRNSERGI